MNKWLTTLGMVLCLYMHGYAQEDNFENDFESFRKSINEDFEDFRKKCNDEYASFLSNPWKQFEKEKPVPKPKEETVPPVIYPKDDLNIPVPEPKPLPYKDVIRVPDIKPQPVPIEPLEDVPNPVDVERVKFQWFGTDMHVRYNLSNALKLRGTKEQNIADAWKEMSSDDVYTNLAYDCLQLRTEYGLCDWAYFTMLKAMSDALCGKESNEATLLMAYIFCQSGYKMRLARDGSGKLHILYASQHVIFGQPYYTLGGEFFYPYNIDATRLYICDQAFPGEQSLSLLISGNPNLSEAMTSARTRKSDKYPDVRVTFKSNKNLMDFYSTYPTSMIGDNMVSRWAMYANTPISENMKSQIYNDLKRAISNCNQLKAVNKLLNFVQTGFTYEYDDKVWGGDRAFFAEESLYYPYCDCEDRSILFTRLVRDLLGLRCILIYYPGHLASAVELTQHSGDVGDYILLGNRKFTIADATYINAPVGMTMPGMDNKTAKVILLE